MDALVQRASELGLTMDPARAARVWVYFQLLARWNARMNLTGLRVAADNPDAIDRLLIEPILASLHAGSAGKVLDVGSGGGSPAVPFAISASSAPELTMVEVRERKSVFLREALRATGLSGEVRTTRFERYAATPAAAAAFDVATVRAVRLDEQLLNSLVSTLRPKGRLFCFHEAGGGRPSTEIPGLSWGQAIELVPSSHSFLTIATRVS